MKFRTTAIAGSQEDEKTVFGSAYVPVRRLLRAVHRRRCRLVLADPVAALLDFIGVEIAANRSPDVDCHPYGWRDALAGEREGFTHLGEECRCRGRFLACCGCGSIAEPMTQRITAAVAKNGNL